MNKIKKYLALLISIVVIVCGVFLLLKFKGKKVYTFFKKQKVIGEKIEEPLKITIQPEGQLKELPKGITFCFSKPYPKAIGLKHENISNFINIAPKIKASGEWISDKVYKVHFLEDLMPEVEYKIKILKMPLLIPKAISPKEFSFTTPSFDGQIFYGAWEKEKIKLFLQFTLKPKLEKIREYIKIELNGKEIEPEEIKEGKPNEIVLLVPLKEKEGELFVILKKGLQSEAGFSLKKDIKAKIPIGLSMSVASHSTEEADDGYIVSFSFTSPFEKDIDLVIDEKDISRFISISPEIPFDVTTSRKRLYVLSNFIPKKGYTIRLKPGIKSKKGSILKDEYTFTFTPPEKKRKLKFLYSGRYFGKKGEWNIPLKIAGIKRIGIDIIYLPPENTLFWYTIMGCIEELGEEVLKKTIPVENDGGLWINLKEYLNEPQAGTYLIKVYTQDGEYIEDKIVVVFSDLSIVAKWFKKHIYIWCFNAETLKPEDNVEIEIRTSKNFVFSKGITGPNGFCSLSSEKEKRQPYIIFAKKGNEWTYVHIPTLSIPLSQYDIQGEDCEIPYLAYVYPERDLIRPGETVNIGVVIRENSSYKAISIPVRINIRDPKGNNFLSLSGNTDEYGFCSFAIPTSASSPTGKYIIELISSDKTLYTTSIFVECFVPERLRIDLSLPSDFDPYKEFLLKIGAEFLFGAPASDERYKGRVRADEIPFKHPGYLKYAFGPLYFEGERPSSWEKIIEGNLDEKGISSISLCIPEETKFNNPILLKGNIEVSEGKSGRVSRKTIERQLFTKPFYIGINADTAKITENQPCNISGILLKPTGSIYKGKTNLFYQVFRLSYYYSYEYWEDDYWNRRLNKIPITLKKALSPKDGKFSFSFIPKTSWDDYLIEVADEENSLLSQIKLSGWGWWEEEEKVESPEVLSLRLDKKDYDVGEKVKVSTSLPFEGNILWAVELDKIYTFSFHKANGKIAEWSFKAPTGVSNVYVTALLIRSGGNYLIQRAFGVCKVRVRPTSLKLKMNLLNPSQIKPQSELILKINGDKKFKATIAVVDEGILQITNFKTPDPYTGILRDLRLSINSCESFGFFIKRFMEKPGGGYAAKEEKVFPEARFAKIVSFWNVVESDNEGNALIKIKIPQFNGKLRVMVAGVSKDGLSKKEKSVVVKSNLIISPTIPRFMSTDDSFSFPITFINTTNKKEEIDLSIDAKGCLVNPKDVEVPFYEFEKRTLWFDGKASDCPGSISIKIKAKSKTETYYEDFVIPLYPNAPYITQSEYIDIPPSETLDLAPYFKNWYPKAHKAKLILSSFPGISRLSHARYAIGYPYGCIEQTSTSLLVLLRLSSLLPIIAPEIPKERYVDMVNAGIRRLISMQTISGALSFWPGEGYEASPYSNAYACFVLLEAKASGFFVPDGVLSSLLLWLNNISDNNGFRFFCLAKGGLLKKRPDLIDRLIAQVEKKEFSQKDLLWIAETFNHLGKTLKAKEFLKAAISEKPENIRRCYDDFYSPLQQLGMRLYVVEDIMPNSSLEKNLVSSVTTALAHKNSWWYTTQELAWCLLSLGRYAERVDIKEFTGLIKINGKVIYPRKEKYGLVWQIENPGKKRVTLETQSILRLSLNIENTGFSKEESSYKPYSNNIVIEKRIFDYSGKPIDSLKMGDQAIIEVKVWSNYSYENVAVEIPIPAGFEIENPRLVGDYLPNWVSGNLWTPNYVDIRDDKAIIFGRTQNNPVFYYLQTRATTPGRFFLSPLKAMVMYDPEIRANTDAEIFRIIK